MRAITGTPSNEPGSQAGAAMIIVLIWTAVLSIIAVAVAQAVLSRVRPSDQAERSYAAWAAAEAGVEDMRARLAANGDYWKQVRDFYTDPVANAAIGAANPALSNWSDVPGGPSAGQFSYWLDTSAAARTGRLIISSTGRSGSGTDEVTRTIEAQLRKRTTADYVYVSDSEAYPWDQPGVYGPNGAISGDKIMARDVARALCGTDGSNSRHWYEWTNWQVNGALWPKGPAWTSGPTSATITGFGPHRNSYACLFGSIKNTDVWVGDMHTNDVWYVDPGINTQMVNVKGQMSSSCPGVSSGSTPQGTCRDNHRWISTTAVGNASNWGKDPTASGYIPDEIPDVAAQNNLPWNPEYQEPLEMPSAAQVAVLRQLAASQGCLYSGPTRVRFGTTSGRGWIQVTSPDTKSTNAFCGGTSLLASNANAHPTWRGDYAEMVTAGFNGVIFVENAKSSDWPSTLPPSCRTKSNGGPYPFIIPDPAKEALSIVSGTPIGLPSAATRWTGNPGPGGKIDEWTDSPNQRCWLGDVYTEAPWVAGGFTGQYTLAADGDIVVTNDIVDGTATDTNPSSATWGRPAATSANQMGLVPSRFLYVYHLDGQAGGNSNGINSALSDLLLDMSILAPNKCLTVQDFKSNPSMETLKIIGSIGQDSRCRIVPDVGSGYQKFIVEYDDRLSGLGPPPYMSELSIEPWRTLVWQETEVRRDIPAKAGIARLTATQSAGAPMSYDVLAMSGAPAGSTLDFARLTSGSGTLSIASSRVAFTAPLGVATTTIEFVLTKPDGVRVAQELVVSSS
jgi:Tfp pilus assembly protein PilX